MNKIKVIVKEPGKKAEWREIEGDLSAMQKIVGGKIKRIDLFTDMAILCNENAKQEELPYNDTVCGIRFFGSVVFSGIKKGGQFADCPVLPGFFKMEVE